MLDVAIYCRSGLKMMYSIAFAWYSIISVIIVLVVGIIISVITGMPLTSNTLKNTYFK